METKPSGLFNRGNTCYFNSAIQLLLGCGSYVENVLRKGVQVHPKASRQELCDKLFSVVKMPPGQQASWEVIIRLMGLFPELAELAEFKISYKRICNDVCRAVTSQSHGKEFMFRLTPEADQEQSIVNVLFSRTTQLDLGTICDGCKRADSTVFCKERLIKPPKRILLIEVKNYGNPKLELPCLFNPVIYIGSGKFKLIYYLCGSIDHYGSHEQGGHYNARVLSSDQSTAWLCDDSAIREITNEQARPTRESVIIAYRLAKVVIT